MLRVASFVRRAEAYERRIRRLATRLRQAQDRARLKLDTNTVERVCFLTSELLRAIGERRAFLRVALAAASQPPTERPTLH
jgi:hypothetical protein